MKTGLLTFLSLFLSCLVFGHISETEKQILTDLYHSTNGSEWNQQWDLSSAVEDWAGVTVEEGHIVEIRMLFNNLNGELPQSIGGLSQLRVLELSFNKLTGTLPASIGNLEHLEVLALNGNDLNGIIPAELGKLNKLEQLHLSSNQLNGELPTTLANLEALTIFNVFDNNLSGPVPLALASNRNIREFLVAENRFEAAPEISRVLLLNSGGSLDLKEVRPLKPGTKTVIAIETSDDDE